ncbi:MAG: pre-peptidase C-terminal domain-containing protein [Chloroflexi bacterium]|nr:pre-peptidase C-terminal domain-containing protein [Chloroflexota bacterium]
MRNPRRMLALLVILLAAPVLAQTGGYLPYAWEAGDLALVYPEGWDPPLPSEQDGVLTLQLAQTLVAMPETRPPGIPMLTLALIPVEGEADPIAALEGYLFSMGMARLETAPGVLMGYDGVIAERSADADGMLLGLGRAAALPGGTILVIVGRALAANQESFEPLFDAVADSLVSGAASEPLMPAYGALWQTARTAGDGENAFVDLGGLALAADGRLFAVDAGVGVIELDAATGAVLDTISNENLMRPSGIAADETGTLYIADPACRCIFVLGADGQWGAGLDGFGVDAPASVAMTPDGTLFATDQDESGVFVRAFQGDTERAIRFDESITGQPMLAADRGGRLLALAADGAIWALDGESFAPLAEVNTAGMIVNGFAALGSRFLLATENQGVLIAGPDGAVEGGVGRIVATSPLPGEVVSPRGLAAAPDGTVYIADSDGTFGAITAMSLRVEAGRVGLKALTLGVQAQGTLNAQTPRQDWTFAGSAGQWVTISASDNGGGLMDVALRLVGPDGSEVAANDDQEGTDLPNLTDAQIPDLALPLDGVYTVQVARVDGSGSYSLGVSREQVFDLSGAGVTRLRGSITAALPVERWSFAGRAGQTLTLTLQTISGTLDPMLALLAPDGSRLAENDDAADAAMGKDAQIVQVRLPADGMYRLEARRFEGDGDYELVIVVTS